MLRVDPKILALLRPDERVIATLNVEFIRDAFSKRMFKLSSGPEGTIALTTDRVVFVGKDKSSREDVIWQADLDEVRSAAYYPFTLQVFALKGAIVRFPVIGFDRGGPARDWAAKVRDLVGFPPKPDMTGVVDGEWQTKRLIELRTRLRAGEITQSQFDEAKSRLFSAPPDES